jgi:hypothetical protein
MSKFTKGPWVKDYNGAHGHIKSTAEHPDMRTPTVARYDVAVITVSKEEEEEANGKLIAAAPDLLAALQEIIARNEIQHWFNLDQAKAAVAKAI